MKFGLSSHGSSELRATCCWQELGSPGGVGLWCALLEGRCLEFPGGREPEAESKVHCVWNSWRCRETTPSSLPVEQGRERRGPGWLWGCCDVEGNDHFRPCCPRFWCLLGIMLKKGILITGVRENREPHRGGWEENPPHGAESST